MNREVLWEDCARAGVLANRPDNLDARVLRSQLVNLTLDWELAALALDAQRYRAGEFEERESLRNSANAFRKCIAELTEVLAGSTLLASKPESQR